MFTRADRWVYTLLTNGNKQMVILLNGVQIVLAEDGAIWMRMLSLASGHSRHLPSKVRNRRDDLYGAIFWNNFHWIVLLGNPTSSLPRVLSYDILLGKLIRHITPWFKSWDSSITGKFMPIIRSVLIYDNVSNKLKSKYK